MVSPPKRIEKLKRNVENGEEDEPSLNLQKYIIFRNLKKNQYGRSCIVTF